jgi:hypothetical protein
MKSYFLESNSVVAIYITCAKYDFGTAKLMEKHQHMLGKERYKSNKIEKRHKIKRTLPLTSLNVSG